LTYNWERLIKERGRIFALLSFVSFSKLVILVYTGQPVENNTAYARYNPGPHQPHSHAGIALGPPE
jgi:predicted DNA-binding protein (MmcQ/YjbR family)